MFISDEWQQPTFTQYTDMTMFHPMDPQKWLQIWMNQNTIALTEQKNGSSFALWWTQTFFQLSFWLFSFIITPVVIQICVFFCPRGQWLYLSSFRKNKKCHIMHLELFGLLSIITQFFGSLLPNEKEEILRYKYPVTNQLLQLGCSWLPGQDGKKLGHISFHWELRFGGRIHLYPSIHCFG